MSTPNTVSRFTLGRKVKTAGTALALTAAVTLGGIAMAAPANAATTVPVGNAALPDGSFDKAGAYAKARERCATNPTFINSGANPIRYSATWYISYWNCP